MDLPGLDDWITRLPDEPLCDCRAEDCDECRKLREAEEAFERMVDRQIDEAKEKEWDR